jgi:Rrf2 family protein
MITREVDYAIRAVVGLAGANGKGLSTAELARDMDIPYPFLRRIVLKLSIGGLVASARGRSGGLRLRRQPSTLSLLDVVRVMDPLGVTLNACLADETVCRRSHRCGVHAALAKAQHLLDNRLARVTVARLAWLEKRGRREKKHVKE